MRSSPVLLRRVDGLTGLALRALVESGELLDAIGNDDRAADNLLDVLGLLVDWRANHIMRAALPANVLRLEDFRR